VVIICCMCARTHASKAAAAAAASAYVEPIHLNWSGTYAQVGALLDRLDAGMPAV
jgi:hypothetical protein